MEMGRATALRDWCHWQRRARVTRPLVSMITDCVLAAFSRSWFCERVQSNRRVEFELITHITQTYVLIHNRYTPFNPSEQCFYHHFIKDKTMIFRNTFNLDKRDLIKYQQLF